MSNPDMGFFWGLAIGSGECLERDLRVLAKAANKSRLTVDQVDAIRFNEIAEELLK